MGLPVGHPEKDGALVDMSDLVEEVRKRIRRKAEEDDVAAATNGMSLEGETSTNAVDGS